MSADANDPKAIDDKLASIVSTMITVSDPRLILAALLGNASELAKLILHAERGTPAQVASAFSHALVNALKPHEEKKDEETRIEVVPAGVIDLSTRRPQ